VVIKRLRLLFRRWNGIFMPVQKDCADYLRTDLYKSKGHKLGSSHAHELVAAFFGYPTAAALIAEVNYPLANLAQAEVLMPNLHMMDQRVQQLNGLLPHLLDVDDLATKLCAFLKAQQHFSGDVWQTRDFEEHINVHFIQKNPMMIEEALTSQVALTNAHFDELYVEEVTLGSYKDDLVATVTGSLNGQHDEDRVFYGDKVNFETLITFTRVAGRAAYRKPKLETDGALDTSFYD
jgi:hypothetical protein